jgi:predicted nucleic acid-binding protein
MPIKVFLDTNVIVDALGERVPFNRSAQQILSLNELGKIRVVVSALTFSTTEYVLSKYFTREVMLNRLRLLKSMCEIVPLDEHVLEQSLAGPLRYFEDCIQYHSAIRAKCDLIITRDERDFVDISLAVLHPEAFIKSI